MKSLDINNIFGIQRNAAPRCYATTRQLKTQRFNLFDIQRGLSI